MSSETSKDQHLILITARSGSKRIPGKNLRLLQGKPLIAWTIETALQSEVARSVIVSTDSEEIAKVATEFGATVPFMRPATLASDDASSVDVALHALDSLPVTQQPKYLTLLQPTSPLREVADIVGAVESLIASAADAVVGVTLCQPHNHYRTINASGFLEPFGATCRPIARINGAIYVVRIDAFRAAKSFYPSKTLPYPMPFERSVDIDDEAGGLERIPDHRPRAGDPVVHL